MREFVYYSKRAYTSGNFKDLMKAGRLDIAIHTIISAFFLSNKLREDITLHLIFNGPPDPPKHLEFISDKEMPISKKDIAKLLKIMLYKYKKDKKIKVFPGCFIEKKPLQGLIKELSSEKKKIYLLDKKGGDIRNIKFGENPVFILGDQEGIPKTELKFIKKYAKLISLGQLSYFSSQTVTIINHELDRKLYK
jgi:tRNA (pseudouridine54-N1)-methyltransferase